VLTIAGGVTLGAFGALIIWKYFELLLALSLGFIVLAALWAAFIGFFFLLLGPIGFDPSGVMDWSELETGLELMLFVGIPVIGVFGMAVLSFIMLVISVTSWNERDYEISVFGGILAVTQTLLSCLAVWALGEIVMGWW